MIPVKTESLGLCVMGGVMFFPIGVCTEASTCGCNGWCSVLSNRCMYWSVHMWMSFFSAWVKCLSAFSSLPAWPRSDPVGCTLLLTWPPLCVSLPLSCSFDPLPVGLSLSDCLCLCLATLTHCLLVCHCHCQTVSASVLQLWPTACWFVTVSHCHCVLQLWPTACWFVTVRLSLSDCHCQTVTVLQLWSSTCWFVTVRLSLCLLLVWISLVVQMYDLFTILSASVL